MAGTQNQPEKYHGDLLFFLVEIGALARFFPPYHPSPFTIYRLQGKHTTSTPSTTPQHQTTSNKTL
jgi:hypothetical protein